MDMGEVFAAGRVIPVVQLDDADDAVPMARALLAGGIRTVEITLRTPAALDAIRAVAAEVPEIAAGAGTLLNPADLDAAQAAGAAFFVSPGLTPDLLAAAAQRGLAYLPGAATAAELMLALDHGFSRLKFFPAAPLGADTIKSFAGPFPQVRFCTTGGISRDNAKDFLALPNVDCVGASWIVTAAALDAKDWAAIEANARFAAGL
ncbi:MAG: bifunctional 4-hydroxy-2-oxoglutarate aldolase/2-dehydro-3-deoxy-phosphogluconate aldolase [Sphingomonadaceae bacterium]|nr:bifunctional 4-hydroxy-2-oxoglutarate aldolase/2-dehydro-3-deoxy-phosphogluconate aldolase [Sphingomonadaceae bacterium]